MAFIYRPDGETDLANAVLVAETGLPQDITGVSAGDWEVGRVEWQAGAVTVASAPGSVNWVALNGTDNWLGNFVAGGASETKFTIAIPMRTADVGVAGTDDLFEVFGNVGQITIFRNTDNLQFYAEDFSDSGFTQALPTPADADIGFMMSIDLAASGDLGVGVVSQVCINGTVVENSTSPTMTSLNLAAIGLFGKEGSRWDGAVGGWVAMGNVALDLNTAYSTYFDGSNAPQVSPAATGMTLFVDGDETAWNASAYVNGTALVADA